ncbi:MAG: signal peptidase II [Spirochaetae bacterium HGW-Spirochaetae-6]|nr:MAG: signal peptidase II [Spirochaetae bacterium HGW-Spirochaetae-6]
MSDFLRTRPRNLNFVRHTTLTHFLEAPLLKRLAPLGTRFAPYIIPGMILVIDILIKKIIKTEFHYGQSVSVLGNFFKLTYIENPGIAFGLFGDIPNSLVKNLIFTAVTLGAIVFIIFMIRSNKHKTVRLSLYFILGGALGNVLERIFGHIIYFGNFEMFYGRVVDFLDFGIGTHRWPAFNIADSFITIGVSILLIYTLFFEKKEKK